MSDYVPTKHERESAEAREALWNALGRRPDELFAIASALTAAEERGRRSGVEERDELRAALKAAEKDRDTWKRLCEKADAQATTATIRANKLADKRGYDIDDDAEERGRRRGVEDAAKICDAEREAAWKSSRYADARGDHRVGAADAGTASTAQRLGEQIRALAKKGKP